MSRSFALKTKTSKKSKQAFDDLSSKNQFLDVHLQFKTLESQRSEKITSLGPTNPKVYTSVSASKNQKRLSLTNNRSIKQMLTDIKEKETRNRQMTEEVQRREFQQKMFEKQLKEFEMAQKRIKRRIQLEQKRVRSKEFEFRINQNKRPMSSRQKLIARTLSMRALEPKHEKTIKVEQQFDYSDRKMFANSQRFSQSKVVQFSNIVLPTHRPNPLKNHSKNVSQIIQPNKSNVSNRNFQKIAIKKKKKTNIQEGLQAETRQQLAKKYKQYASPRNKNTIQHQLERIYKPSKKSDKKAQELADNMSSLRRLQLKSGRQMDYAEAESKIKLLQQIYDIKH